MGDSSFRGKRHAAFSEFSPPQFQRDSSLAAAGNHFLEFVQDSGCRAVLLDQHSDIHNLSQLADMLLDRPGRAALRLFVLHRKAAGLEHDRIQELCDFLCVVEGHA